ncbi:caspase family protein [Calothrix sp. CCY 0018]|uniref:caspase family protein n=1 Tax=Calothrix sp. CCY 0018 TaxID=3103864 RepID=UPI0039C705AC
MTGLTNFYALLIGIDFYGSNNLFNNLKGCVGDIDLVAGYLQNSLQVPQSNIWKLTSPFEEDSSLSKVRSAQKELKPTYENIVNAFKEITATAKKGEQVYIHYSGHGGRALTIYPELKGEGLDDESIVPCDIGSSGNRYLRDVEIATLIKRLTDKGCIVTVIFDSCHSGGATRGDCAIRGSENNGIDTAPRNQESLVASRKELLNNWQILTKNDSNKSTAWLPKTEDYVFLAACRPSEYAYEYAVSNNSDKRNGALTYWMIDTLGSSTSPLTYRSLYNRVKGMVQSKFPQQLPMLTGNGDRLVFGVDTEFRPYAVNIVKVSDNQQEITLDAGLAQGLRQGTSFAIYPQNVKDFADKTQQKIAIVEITESQADKSTATIVDAAAGGIEVKDKIEPGAAAVMLAAPVDLIRKVRFFDRKQPGEKENELPLELVDGQTAALEKVRQAMKENGWVVEVKEGEEAHYQVAVGRDGEYEISIGMPLENLRPKLMINNVEAPQKVVERLVHLVKYQSVQALDNPASDLSEYIEFELCDANKQPLANAENLTLKAGTVSYLKVKNNYTKPLNIAVLDLVPTWKISQIPIQGDDSPFFALQTNQQAYTKLRLRLGDGYQQAKESLKIFVTKGLANFQWLTLPALDSGLETRGNLNLYLKEKAEELKTRGNVQSINPLNNLLSQIGADIDNPPDISREFIAESEPDEEWTTQQIQVTVTQ